MTWIINLSVGVGGMGSCFISYSYVSTFFSSSGVVCLVLCGEMERERGGDILTLYS